MSSRSGGDHLRRECRGRSRYGGYTDSEPEPTSDSGIQSQLGEGKVVFKDLRSEINRVAGDIEKLSEGNTLDMSDTDGSVASDTREAELSKRDGSRVKSKCVTEREPEHTSVTGGASGSGPVSKSRGAERYPGERRSVSRHSAVSRHSSVARRSRDRVRRDVEPSESESEEVEEQPESDPEFVEEEEYSPRAHSRNIERLLEALASTAVESKRNKLTDYTMREVQSIASFRDGDEIHSYIMGLESDLTDIGVPTDKWKRILLRKLTPKARKTLRGYVVEASCSYPELKSALVKKLGMHRHAVTEKLFGMSDRELRAMDPVARFIHLRDYVDRLMLNVNSTRELPLAVVAGIFRTSLTTNEKCMLDSRDILSFEDLYDVAELIKADHNPKHYNDKGRSSGRHTYNDAFKCFKCQGVGHRASECKKSASDSVTCYVCNQPGHKAPDCPNRADKLAKKEHNKVDEKSTSTKKHQSKTQAGVSVCNTLIEIKGKCNGQWCMFLPDSGAVLSMVSANLVLESDYLGTYESLVLADDRVVRRPLARVEFELRGRTFNQVVAVSQQGERESFVFLSAPPMSEEDAIKAVEDLCDREVERQSEQSGKVEAKPPPVPVSSVMTRAATKKAVAQAQKEESSECDVIPPVSLEPGVCAPNTTPAGEGEAVPGMEVKADSVEESDRNCGNGGSEEECELDDLGSPETGEVCQKDDLRKEIGEDSSLKHCCDLADRKANGFVWDDGLLFQDSLNSEGDVLHRLVLPTSKREKVLQLAHNKNGHIGAKSMRRLINRKFTWPGLSVDVVKHARECSDCLKHNRVGNKTAKMVERPVISIPFESVAFDLVGPLPKARGGVKHILTYICMASRWPEAIPLRSITAEAVATAMTHIIFRTGIPLKILCDRGTVFVSKLADKLCEMLGIDKIHSSPYRPQSNGVLERFHGTLKPMLSKAVENGIDWSDFLPMALFAIRQVPCRSTGFSPHELVFGRNMIGPLDLVYSGWVDDVFENIEVCDWVLCLQEKLCLLHDLASANELSTIEARAKVFNKNKSERELHVGDLVMLRVPGLHVALTAAWEGPYLVSEKISRVTYKVKREGSDNERVVHINNLKTCTVNEPKKHLAGISVIAEESVEMEEWLEKSMLGDENCEGYKESEISKLLERKKECFSDSPGLCTIGECEVVLSDNHQVVNIPPRNIPIHIRPQVEAEINKLLTAGIIVPSEEEWCSPIVPVKKKDGSIRICVDYRELNAITPLRRFWLPSLREIMDQVGPCSVLSKLDLTSGFHQIRMSDESSKLTTFSCPLGNFRYVRMPFGLKNAPGIFQRVVERVLEPVKHCSRNYIDDVIVFSKSWEVHIEDVCSVLETLHEAGLKVKFKKCEFGRKCMSYLGHQIGCGRLGIPEARVNAMRNYQQPITKKQMRAFLGSVGYYREFIPGFATHSRLLTPSTSTAAPGRVVWTSEMLEAFRKLLYMLCHLTTLHVPVQGDVFRLFTDASGGGLGGCLHVVRDSKELPVAFFSRQLRGAESRYSVTELESLAIVESIRHFEYYLCGTSFTVVTDHRACLALTTSSHLNKRLMRMALKVQEYDVSIVYRPGKSNGNADGLSRQNFETDEPDLSPADQTSPDPIPDVVQLGKSSQGLAGGPVGPGQERKELKMR